MVKIDDPFESIRSLPVVGLGFPMDKNTAFSGKERVFYEYYKDILGEKLTSEIMTKHGYERSCLYGLHNEAVKVTAIPRLKLMELADGDSELIGFAYQPPTICESWIIPGEHYKLELFVGHAITEPVSISCQNKESSPLNTGMCDSNGNFIKIGHHLRKPTECNEDVHGSWAEFEVKLQGLTSIISYVRSEKGVVIPPGYSASPLCNEYDIKDFCSSDDISSLRPIDQLEIIDSNDSGNESVAQDKAGNHTQKDRFKNE